MKQEILWLSKYIFMYNTSFYVNILYSGYINNKKEKIRRSLTETDSWEKEKKGSRKLHKRILNEDYFEIRFDCICDVIYL